MGKDKRTKTSTFIESGNGLIAKLQDIANYFNDYFIGKVDTIRNQMLPVSESLIKQHIMYDKKCKFEFLNVNIEEMEKLLLSLNCDKPCGYDNPDDKLLQLSARIVAKPLCHIFNLCLNEGVYPQMWKIAKVTPLPKHCKQSFTGPNSRPISTLPVLSKLMEGVVFKQIQHYFSENGINSEFQHAYTTES